MNKILIISIILMLPLFSNAKPVQLTGSVALACQAMLCLSDPAVHTLKECAPALNKYYSIVKKTKLGGIDKVATKDARDAFLSLCPLN